MPENKRIRVLIALLYAAGGVIAVWLGFKYALKWLAPFIFSYITASLLEPAVSMLCKKFSIRRTAAAAFCGILFLALLVGGAIFIAVNIAYEFSSLMNKLPELMSGVPDMARAAQKRLLDYISSAPADLREYLINAAERITAETEKIPGKISGWLLSFAGAFAGAAPRIVLFLITYIIGVFFFSSGYAEITAFFGRQIPAGYKGKAAEIRKAVPEILGKWIKAEATLMCVTFIELGVAFSLMRVEYAVLVAFFTSVIDALPVFGVGTVLIPWAAISLITGNYSRAIVLALTYGVVSIVRSFLEPKLIGKQIGLHPIATLLAMYVGFCACGVWGMILFPIMLIFIKQFNDRGYIHLWKTSGQGR